MLVLLLESDATLLMAVVAVVGPREGGSHAVDEDEDELEESADDWLETLL